MTIRPRDLILHFSNLCHYEGFGISIMLFLASNFLYPQTYNYYSQASKSFEETIINNQVAWPNGHGVSLTTRSEKVPGSIPGATMFFSSKVGLTLDCQQPRAYKSQVGKQILKV
ncbi:hypothetical protein N7537_007661 [Penicillium hordei]|uniref:Uncharacterized protein n=1 Tax=Penicillium hordei TaxID=40994 RepID=A0AAD6DYV3_9EURO|nr:uncharacterized protein N7537_007661 [Penicillium hordei]KAJ5597577.1 hypothetical protein N7537_007661 [Penicillium hordei]